MKVLISVEISNHEAEKAPRRYISRFFQVIGNVFSVNVLSMSRHIIFLHIEEVMNIVFDFSPSSKTLHFPKI